MLEKHAAKILDLRPMIRSQRHVTVFAQVDALTHGESFVLINDHDPLGLRRRLDMEHAGTFDFEYLIAGPTEWQVAITRRAS